MDLSMSLETATPRSFEIERSSSAMSQDKEMLMRVVLLMVVHYSMIPMCCQVTHRIPILRLKWEF